MGGFQTKEGEDENIPKTAEPHKMIGVPISSWPISIPSDTITPTEELTTTTTICMSPVEAATVDPKAVSNEVPTVITWTHGGKQVFVTGSFNNWKEKIPLTKSEKDFTLIENLPPGVHQYKFIVDGKWRHAPDQPIATDVAGNINNTIEVRPITDEIQTRALSSSPPGTYSQSTPDDEYTKEPPAIPPHLLRALLNTAPSADDPAELPLPHHVMINHLYSLYSTDPKNKLDCLILGTTTRYKAKFVTTVFYKPVESNASKMEIV